jgi:hypothetical protein
MNNEATNIARKTKMKFMPGYSCLEIYAWKYEGRNGITIYTCGYVCCVYAMYVCDRRLDIQVQGYDTSPYITILDGKLKMN